MTAFINSNVGGSAARVDNWLRYHGQDDIIDTTSAIMNANGIQAVKLTDSRIAVMFESAGYVEIVLINVDENNIVWGTPLIITPTATNTPLNLIKNSNNELLAIVKDSSEAEYLQLSLITINGTALEITTTGKVRTNTANDSALDCVVRLDENDYLFLVHWHYGGESHSVRYSRIKIQNNQISETGHSPLFDYVGGGRNTEHRFLATYISKYNRVVLITCGGGGVNQDRIFTLSIEVNEDTVVAKGSAQQFLTTAGDSNKSRFCRNYESCGGGFSSFEGLDGDHYMLVDIGYSYDRPYKQELIFTYNPVSDNVLLAANVSNTYKDDMGEEASGLSFRQVSGLPNVRIKQRYLTSLKKTNIAFHYAECNENTEYYKQGTMLPYSDFVDSENTSVFCSYKNGTRIAHFFNTTNKLNLRIMKRGV